MDTIRTRIARLAAAAAPALLLAPATAPAASNAELEKRIERLEAQLRAVREERDGQSGDGGDGAASNPDFDGLLGNTEFELGGYVKLDIMHSTYAGAPAPDNRGRAFYIPNAVPTEADFGNDTGDGVTDFQARESRVNLATVTETGGHRIETFVEFDFLGSLFDGAAPGKETLVNDADPRLRHAYVEWNDTWLFGQTWSNFMDLDAYPENLDFIGPVEGMTFVRQPQVRYRTGPWTVSLENPEATVMPNGGGDPAAADNNSLPDAVLRYTAADGGGGHIGAAVLARQLDGDDIAGVDGRDKAFGYGVSVSGKIMLGRDDIRYQLNYGDGIGRYLGLNTANGGAVLDAGGELETIEAWGGYLSYRHFWSRRWRSNLTLGYFGADNDTDLTGDGANERAGSVHVNLLYSPVPDLTLGGEYLYAQRREESGDDGDLGRFQFAAKYAF